MANSHHLTLAKFLLVWRRLCEALLSSSSLAGQKHPYLLSRLYLAYVGDIKVVCPEHETQIVHYICGHSGCADSDVRSLNMTIVEGPIERHKSRLASREIGDGLTGTSSGGSLDLAESVAKWSRERRAQPGRRETRGRDKAVRSSLHHSLCPEMSLIFCDHKNFQIHIKFSGRVVRGELHVTPPPYPKLASALDCNTVWPVKPSRKTAWQDFTTACI